MSDTSSRNLIVFLSSVYYEAFEGIEAALPLRAAIIDRSRQLGLDLRAHAFDGHLPRTADQIIDKCFADIKECDLFVYLQTRRHGSQVLYAEADVTIATYLEMELFAAAILRKPILILHERGLEAEPQLKDLLTLLERSFGSRQYIVAKAATLIQRFSEVVLAFSNATRISELRIAPTVADELSMLRTQHSPKRDLDDPVLYFLGGWATTAAQSGNVDAAAGLLDTVSGSPLNGDPGISHGAALFRIWAAIRELVSLDRRSPEVENLWDRALGLWATKASWFGLHGHHFMGPLAAVNSQIALRRDLNAVEFSGDTREPLGAKASALYSVAQRMTTPARQRTHYKQAIIQATRAISRDLDGTAGALSIRAHAHLRLALLGRPWQLIDARRDFTVSLSTREQSGAPQTSIGEAEADLGLSMVLTGQPFNGMARLRYGIELLRGDQSPNGRAFLARGLRKLEQGARLTLRRGLAEEARRERTAIASDVEAFDQLR